VCLDQPVVMRWTNPTTRRTYRLSIGVDLLGDIIMLTAWSSLDSKKGGQKNRLLSDVHQIPYWIKKISQERLKKGYILVSTSDPLEQGISVQI